jgi:hypothetical protein
MLIKHKDRFCDETEYIQIIGHQVRLYDKDDRCLGNPGKITRKQIYKNLKEGCWVIAHDRKECPLRRMWHNFLLFIGR